MSDIGSDSMPPDVMVRRYPLDGKVLPVSGGVAVRAAEPAARLILRGDAEAAEAAGVAFGVRLPMRPNRAEQALRDGRAALWLGPDEWLLVAPGEEVQAVAAGLEPALAGHSCSLVDVSSRQTGLVLEGPSASRMLSAGCPLDLRPVAFPVGMATRTLFLKAEIVLWRQSDQRFHVEVWRSFASYLAGHVAEIAADLPQV